MHIRDLVVGLTVNSDGSLDVNERLSIRFTGRWSRIQRDISRRPLTPARPELVVRRVSATDADGQPLRVETYHIKGSGGSQRALNVGIWVTPYPINEDQIGAKPRQNALSAVSTD